MGDPTAVTTAVVVATVPAADGTCAALLPWEGATVLERLLGQLGSLGIADVRVLARPAHEAALRAVAGDRVHPSAATDADLRAIAAIAAEPGAGIVILPGEIITHREALAGLLKDPRVVTGTLLGGGRRAAEFVFRVRSKRGRVISAASPYHAAHRPTSVFLGVLKVAAADRPALAASAARLAELVADPPAEWRDELARKQDMWRGGLWRMAQRGGEEAGDEGDGEDEPADEFGEAPEEPPTPAVMDLSPEDEALLRQKLAAAPRGRDGARARGHGPLGHPRRRQPPAAAVLGPPAVARRRRGRASCGSATTTRTRSCSTRPSRPPTASSRRSSSPPTRATSPAGARTAGSRPTRSRPSRCSSGSSPRPAFATGERWGLVAGAILLQAAFTTDCVDGQLARYTRTFSKLGAWLDSIFDRTKEYVCFAGLAIGACRAGDPVWTLACAAITLQTARHFSDFSFGAGQTRIIGDIEQPPVERSLDAAGIAAAERRALAAQEPADGAVREPAAEAAPPAEPPKEAVPFPRRVLRAWHTIDRLPGVRWVKKMAAFPIGERFAAISLTAALFDPRVTFVVLLSWGGFAVLYTLSGRVLRSIAR